MLRGPPRFRAPARTCAEGWEEPGAQEKPLAPPPAATPPELGSSYLEPIVEEYTSSAGQEDPEPAAEPAPKININAVTGETAETTADVEDIQFLGDSSSQPRGRGSEKTDSVDGPVRDLSYVVPADSEAPDANGLDALKLNGKGPVTLELAPADGEPVKEVEVKETEVVIQQDEPVLQAKTRSEVFASMSTILSRGSFASLTSMLNWSSSESGGCAGGPCPCIRRLRALSCMERIRLGLTVLTVLLPLIPLAMPMDHPVGEAASKGACVLTMLAALSLAFLASRRAAAARQAAKQAAIDEEARQAASTSVGVGPMTPRMGRSGSTIGDHYADPRHKDQVLVRIKGSNSSLSLDSEADTLARLPDGQGHSAAQQYQRMMMQRRSFSSISASSCDDFARRQSEKLRKTHSFLSENGATIGNYMSGTSTAMALELDLPSASPVNSEMVLMTAAQASGKLPPVPVGAVTGDPDEVRDDDRLSYHSMNEGALIGMDSEMVKAEVVNIGKGPQGQSRVRIEFQSRCLKTQWEWQRQLLNQQRKLLEAVSLELQDARKELDSTNDARAEQKEMLRGFRKIITRDISHKEDDSCRVMVFIFEENATLRGNLVEQCRSLEFDFRAFEHLSEGIQDLQKVILPEVKPKTQTPAILPKSSDGNKDLWRRAANAARRAHPGRRFGEAVLRAVQHAREREKLARVVLLGASMFAQVQPGWAPDDVYVALASEPDEFEAVGRSLLASCEAELREKLRAHGISEYVLHPLSMDALKAVVEEGMRRHFGDEFLLLEQLGRGAFGVVYRTKRLRDGEAFALKEINTKRLGKQAQDDVKDEIKLLRELKWPTVLFLVDAWTSSGDTLHYLLMPILDGGNLEQRLSVLEGVPIDALTDWYTQTLHGVTYIHWRGVLHRDMKPGNLVLNNDGRALRIGDFGSAARVEGPGPYPRKDLFVGESEPCTPDFAGPEVLEHKTFYFASDMWSVGVTFRTVLTWAHLMGSGSVMEGDIEELCNEDHLQRPCAASLTARPDTRKQLKAVFKATQAAGAEPAMQDAHMREVMRLVAESLTAFEAL